MTTDTAVVYLDSTMSGAPALSGEVGKLIAVLDAALVNGFGSITLDSLVIVDNVATGTISTGHNLAMVGDTGPVILIEGASAPAAINGRFRIQTIPNATTFTFITSGISNQTATGTITAKRASAGWEKAFSATNKAAYRRLDPASTAMLLRVDDTPAQYPTLIMYEAMTDVDTGTGAAPTSGSFYIAKSSTANSTARAWRLVADALAVYLFIDSGSFTYPSGFSFGDILSYHASDAYHCMLIAHSTAAVLYNYLYILNNSTGSLLARAYSQLGSAVAAQRYSHNRSGNNIGGAGQAYPAPVDNAVHAWPVEAWEGTTLARGMMPGLWNPIHAAANIPDGTLITDVPQLPDRTFLAQVLGANNSCALLDLAGPWR